MKPMREAGDAWADWIVPLLMREGRERLEKFRRDVGEMPDQPVLPAEDEETPDA